MTDTNELYVQRIIGVLTLLMGLVFVWFDFDRVGDTTYAAWQQLPVLATIGGMMITVGIIQLYWCPLRRMMALGWFYLLMGAAQSANAAIGWNGTESALSTGALAGFFSIFAGMVCFSVPYGNTSDRGVDTDASY